MVCVHVCLLDITVSCAKMAELIKMLLRCGLGWALGKGHFGGASLQCGLLLKFSDHLCYCQLMLLSLILSMVTVMATRWPMLSGRAPTCLLKRT